MVIRPATSNDAPTIASFQIAMALETENKTLQSDTVETAVLAVINDPGKGFVLVIEVNDQVVGSLMVTNEWSDWRNFNIWYIQSVFIVKEHRGQGLFKQMYQHVLDIAPQNGVQMVRLYVETENLKAQKAYESLGMKRMPYFMYEKHLTEHG